MDVCSIQGIRTERREGRVEMQDIYSGSVHSLFDDVVV